jgi:RNA polymerase sigma-70 factor (ECF subfamily)
MSDEEFNKQIAKAMQKAKAYLLSKYSLNEADLDDVLQDASIKAMKALKSFRGRCAFETWFISICRNEARALFRKRQRQSELPFQDGNVQKDELWHDAEILTIDDVEERAFLVNQSLAKMSEKHREIIRLALQQTRTSQEVADILKIPVNSARTRLHYAKKHLKKLLQNNAHQPNT